MKERRVWGIWRYEVERKCDDADDADDADVADDADDSDGDDAADADDADGDNMATTTTKIEL